MACCTILGILVLTNRFPNIMSGLFSTAMENKEETIDFNHHEAGAWSGHKWKLPYELIDVIEHHHDLTYEERNSNFVILIGFCSRISRQWVLDTKLRPYARNRSYQKTKL